MISSLDLLIGNETVVQSCRWLLIIILLFNLRSAFKRETKSGTGFFWLFIFMTLYCVFYSPKSGDNFASMATYYSFLNGEEWELLHFERIYFRVMEIISFGYVYYRLFVWGAACLLCVWLMKKMKIKSQIATLSILTFALPLLLYYQRAAFAYVLLYVAVYSYVSKGELFDSIPFFKRNYKILSIFLLLCTIPFHTTMPIYVTFLLFAFFVPKNEIGVLFLLGIVFIVSASLVSNTISILNFFQEDTIETGMRTLEGDAAISGQNFLGALGDFLHVFPIYCMLLYGLYLMIQFPKHHTRFEKICLMNTLVLLLTSILFMSFSVVIQVKFRNASMMPWTLYIASYYTRNCGSFICSAYAFATILTFFI